MSITDVILSACWGHYCLNAKQDVVFQRIDRGASLIKEIQAVSNILGGSLWQIYFSQIETLLKCDLSFKAGCCTICFLSLNFCWFNGNFIVCWWYAANDCFL